MLYNKIVVIFYNFPHVVTRLWPLYSSINCSGYTAVRKSFLSGGRIGHIKLPAALRHIQLMKSTCDVSKQSLSGFC